jgi:FkbM family methyltransferase
MSIEEDYLRALKYRETLPKKNQFDIAKLQTLPSFFNWVDCEVGPKARFNMFLAGADDGVALRFFWNGGYEKFTTTLWSNFAARSTNIVVDIGAHTGSYTLAALASGCGPIVSFEPHFMNFSRLLMNLRGNGFSTEGAYMLGVGRTNEASVLSISTNLGYLTTGGKVGARDGCANFPISLVSLDRFFDPAVHKIDLLKIDVEGHEPNVLTGAIELLRHSKPDIFFECLSDEAGLEIESLLEPLGYKFWLVDDLEGGLAPVDRLRAEFDSNGGVRMSRLNRIASCSVLG